MASSSIFPTMKAVNPATLGGRLQNQLTAIASKDEIEKDYDLRNFGEGGTEMTIDNMSLYYGSRGQKFLSFEGSYILSSGSREISVNPRIGSPRSTKNDLEYSLVEGSIALGKYIGVSFAKQTYQNTTDYEFQFDGTHIILVI